MAIIPQRTNLIEAAIEDKVHAQNKRTYLGMSGIGGSCLRKQWYSWRWVKDSEISARTKRIFERGDLEEPRIVKDLEAAGIIFSDEQLEVKHITKHCLGHIDGLVENVPGAEKTMHLAEFKTMKASSFNALKKKAALLEDFGAALLSLNPTYYAQIMLYMGYLKLTRCLYVVTNKDNEERIYERINFDPRAFEALKDRILDIVMCESPPMRVSDRADWFECRWCDFKDICFNSSSVGTNCRTCRHSSIEDEGEWSCGLNNKELDKEDQLKGCKSHRFIKGL